MNKREKSKIISSDALLTSYIKREYVKNQRSWGDLATELGTYANKLRRFANKHSIAASRDKSEAQKLALKSGRHKHPTKDTVRSDETKYKISEGVAASWKAISPEEYERRQEIGKEQWSNMSAEKRDKLLKAAAEGVRKSAKFGSKLENFVTDYLTNQKISVESHKENFIGSHKLHLDIFVPHLKTAIEIDGPTHFFPIWGQEALQRHIKSDIKKNALLLEKGYVVVRVKHMTKHLSQKKMRDVAKSIHDILINVGKKFPTKNNRLIEIEV